MPTPHQVILDTMGGTTAVARMLGLPESTVRSWRVAGQIPAQHHQRLFEAAAQHNLPLHPQDLVSKEWRDGTSEWQRQRAQSRGPAEKEPPAGEAA